MTEEEKKLLIKDLCVRLPYKVICYTEITNCINRNSVLLEEYIYSFRTGRPTIADYGQHDYYKTVVLELKPYLRPMSSMTDEEKLIFEGLMIGTNNVSYMSDVIDWLNANHFDYRGLIEKGLAIEVTKENNPYK